ncbi:MAG: aminomethyl-transferring glycine dehydrogenase subunit GcvPA [Planctomycetes bacterium]|nr:aminomethyl-transferring glycine dehydrogenase subunit GcvPA [Planctomycetota bacterium]
MGYVPHDERDRAEMLAALGKERLEDLFRTLPEEIRLRRPLDIPPMRTEAEILREMRALASRNSRMTDRPSFLGAGVYHRFIPSAVDHLASRGEFSTSYTPYQAEVSQGTLQAIMEYQTMICELTGMDLSNASLYDGATALAEAVLMAYAVRRRGTKVIVSEGVHPEYRRVLETYLRHHPVDVVTLPLVGGITAPEALGSLLEDLGPDVLAVAVQSPNFLGSIEEMAAVARVADARGEERPFLVAVVDPISLAVLEPPGSFGVDVVVGDGQQLGNPPSLGGPSFGFFTSRQEHVRKVPGRLVGETRDRDGKRGYVLTFQTREQHIRRERATSNICTNQGLCSLRAAIYLALLGKQGLREVAETSARKAHRAFRMLAELPGVSPASGAPFFQEFALAFPIPAGDLYRRLAERGIGGGLPLGRYFPERSHQMLFAFTEMTRAEDIARLAEGLREILLET